MCNRQKLSESFGYTESLSKLIDVLCSDFDRREGSIAEGLCSERTMVEFKYYNYKMLEGAGEIVGPELARIMISEIGHRVGYAKTKINCMSESMYKNKKLECKIQMAKKLHLID